MHALKAIAVAVAAVVLAGCGTVADWGDSGNSFEDRAEALTAVYEQGKRGA